MTRHAREEVERRGIPPDWLQRVLSDPEQVVEAFGGRRALQSRFEAEGRTYLLRVIVEDRGGMTRVVTAYRTSKVKKYWRTT